MLRAVPAQPVLFGDAGFGKLEGGGEADEVDVLVDGVEGLRVDKEDRERLVVDQAFDLGGELALAAGVHLNGELAHELLELLDRWAGAERAGLAVEFAVHE